MGHRPRGTGFEKLLAAVLLGVLAGCAAPVASQPSTVTESVITLEPRPGVTLDVLVLRPPKATAVLVLLEGGPGRLGISGGPAGPRIRAGGGFLVRGRHRFATSGLAVALVDAPSDKQSGRGLLQGNFRAGPEHLTDIEAVIRRLRRDTGLPVWLVGMSIGSRSAARAAIEAQEAVDGLVLVSSSTRPPFGLRSVADFGLEKLKVPVLAVAHRQDGCPGTPPAGAQGIVKRAVNARDAKVLIFDGGETRGGHPCRPFSHHTFLGIEDRVAAGIAEYVKSAAAPATRP